MYPSGASGFQIVAFPLFEPRVIRGFPKFLGYFMNSFDTVKTVVTPFGLNLFVVTISPVET